MLRILCKELIEYVLIEKDMKGNDHMSINTTDKIVRALDTSRPWHGDKNDIIENNGKQFYPIKREILKINAPIVDEYIKNPMRIKVYENDRKIPQVEINTIPDNYDNRANIYVIGFPFNGIVKPIPEDPKYRIYKGLLASSAIPFECNGKKYRKVLYLVVEPNLNLFTPDHKYHTDEIQIKMESYALKPREDNVTVHESYTVTIQNSQGDFNEEWDSEILPEPVDVKAMSDGIETWTTFKFEKRDEGEQASEKKHSGKKEEHAYIKGDVLITKNKHGIRKEVPLHGNNKSYKSSYNKYEEDDEYEYRPKNRKKPSKTKKTSNNWK